MNNNDKGFYTYPSICNRTEDCLYGWLTDYCPNKHESCEGKEKHFFCSESKTCIPNGNNFAHISSMFSSDG